MSIKKIKLWSSLGQRAVFGLELMEIAKEDQNIMVLSADVSTSAGLDRFRKKYPDQYVELGIAEQNMIGVATGLAALKYNVFTTTFAPFQTLRCAEQIKINLSYMKMPVKMVGLASGLSLGNLGFSHCSIEDIGAMRSLPNISIISPADCFELYKVLRALQNYNLPVYLRLTGSSNSPIIYDKDYEFKIGRANKITNGKDILIIANGSVVYNALKASELLKEKGISTTLLNMHTIKPLDKNSILENLDGKKLVITVEEHNVIGGIGSAVAELIVQYKNNCKMLFLGVEDNFSKAGSYDYMLKNNNLTPDLIEKKILEKLKQI
jgi:transketolase